MKKLKALKRERVNRALEDIFNYPMTIVEAPMGYGKTTAVREFLALKGVPVIWTSFLSEDDKASWFWERLATEIGKLDKTAESRLKSLGIPSDTPQTIMAISIVNEMVYKPDTTLVVDDFHLAKSMKMTSLFRRFVMEMPDNFHIVILTRDTTNLDISELYVKGLCNVVSQNTLRFTESEIRDYCSLMGFTVGESVIRKIGDYTGGWISLIYLIILGVERGISVNRNGAINELVEKVLYNPYDEYIKRYLLRLSVMDSFTAEKAAFITQEEESEKILSKLRRENAFIAFNEAAGVYIIHNVLLDYLRGKQRDEEECAVLNRRLGEWHLARREYRTAYGYFFRAGEREHHMVKSAKSRALLGEEVFYAHIYDGHRDVVNSNNKYSLNEILQEAPDIVVLDELAMKGRNIDDSARSVCDDVKHLLKMGIHVYSTVNLLHFSYINEACKDKTGFHVKTPLSDEWLVQAKNIVFIDCAPEALNHAYNNKKIFTKINKSTTTDLIFRLENLRLYRAESLQFLERFSQVKCVNNKIYK